MLSALHVHVRWVMSASIAAAFTLRLTVQHQPLPDVLRYMLTGYAAPDAAAGASPPSAPCSARPSPRP